MNIFVEIVESATDQVVRRFGPYPSERRADRVQDGADINLNHEKFFTRQVTE